MAFSVIKRQSLWWTLSAIAVMGSLITMTISLLNFQAPLRPSLDFVGGTRLQLTLACAADNSCAESLTSGPVQDILTAQGLGSSSVQIIDRYTVSIRTQTIGVEERTELQEALNEQIGTFNPESIQIDTVGPTIGRELFKAGILSLLVSFLLIIVYLTIRFKLDYAVFAILALFHDALITVGVFAALGLIAGVEVDSLFLVALLTIIGFSVNDTVVIYDRIRENLQRNYDIILLELFTDIKENIPNETARSLNDMGDHLREFIARNTQQSIDQVYDGMLDIVEVDIDKYTPYPALNGSLDAETESKLRQAAIAQLQVPSGRKLTEKSQTELYESSREDLNEQAREELFDRFQTIIDRNMPKSISQVIDSAVAQSFTRSINTTLTTLLPLVAIFLFGGATLKFFALALIIGFSLGAYSSIFLASTLLAWWREQAAQN